MKDGDEFPRLDGIKGGKVFNITSILYLNLN